MILDEIIKTINCISLMVIATFLLYRMMIKLCKYRKKINQNNILDSSIEITE